MFRSKNLDIPGSKGWLRTKDETLSSGESGYFFRFLFPLFENLFQKKYFAPCLPPPSWNDLCAEVCFSFCCCYTGCV